MHIHFTLKIVLLSAPILRAAIRAYTTPQLPHLFAENSEAFCTLKGVGWDMGLTVQKLERCWRDRHSWSPSCAPPQVEVLHR